MLDHVLPPAQALADVLQLQLPCERLGMTPTRRAFVSTNVKVI